MLRWGRIGGAGDSKLIDETYLSDDDVLKQAVERADRKYAEGYRAVGVSTEADVEEAGEVAQVTDSFSAEGTNEDGWPVINGRAVRPDEASKVEAYAKRARRITADDMWSGLPQRFAEVRSAAAELSGLRERVIQRQKEANAQPVRVVEITVIATKRVLDFEE